ncbi:MAG: hypothetical protein SGI87_05120 [Flavobacteriales bacterium]|nr:hypothetical protein [Flavobacteriales bacterium]
MKSISIKELEDRNKYRRLTLRTWEKSEVNHTLPERELEKVEERNKRMMMDGDEDH